MGRSDDLMVVRRDERRGSYRIQTKPVLLEQGGHFGGSPVGNVASVLMVVPESLVVLGIGRTVAGMMVGSVGNQDDDALRVRTKRQRGRIGKRVELILGDIAAAAGVQRTDPLSELVDAGGQLVAVGAIAIGGLRDHIILEGHQSQTIVAMVGLQ